MSELIVVGDRVLIRPQGGERETKSGLLLPATVAEKEKVRGGQVVRVGPGYAVPNPEFSDEPWKPSGEAVRYMPLQAAPGDFAFFLRTEGIEIKYQGEDFLIVPHGAILALVRPDAADDYGSLEGL